MDFVVLPPPYEKYSINRIGDIMNNKRKNILSKWINRHGYKYYTLRNSKLSVKRNLSQHRLLAIAFIENPDNLPCIDHIDRNRKNNDLNNLRWCSYQMNSINKDSKNPLGRGITYSVNKKRFHVNLFRNGKKKWIGVYDTHEEAKSAYRKAVEDWYEDNKTTKTTPVLE